jgi:hypothetical protein
MVSPAEAHSAVQAGQLQVLTQQTALTGRWLAGGPREPRLAEAGRQLSHHQTMSLLALSCLLAVAVTHLQISMQQQQHHGSRCRDGQFRSDRTAMQKCCWTGTIRAPTLAVAVCCNWWCWVNVG